MGFFDKAEGTAQFFDQKDIEKAYGTKYKSKKLINGKWRYYYVDGREESVKWHDHNANKSEIREFIKESFNNSEYKENIKICDLPSHFSDKLKLKIGERPTKLIMNSDGLRHSLNLERHKINPEDILLLQKVIQNKHTIIRNAGKSKRRKNDLIEFTGYSRGTIKFILAIDEKNKELRLFDCYREGKIEKSVRFPCTSPETNALDGSQPIISINFIDNLSTEKLNKSLSIDDRLLRLWQRRLSPELENEGAGLLKIYNHICKETGLDFVTVVNKYGVTKDGYYYDLENPTEKFYFDLKNKLDEAEHLEKSGKYIKRWFSNGEWHYKYPSKYKANQNRTETKKDIAQSTKLITGIEPLEAKTEKDIDDAIVQLALYANEHELKCAALGNHRIYITGRTQEHIKETHNEPRTDAEMKHKAKYIPFVPEILKHGKICEKSSSKEGVIYGIIGQVKYFDKKKNKNVIESVELAINYDKDSRKFVFSFADKSIKKSLLNNRDFDTFSVCPIVDTETVPITVCSLSETPILSSGTVNKSMSDKLFALWTRRLSPEFCNELKKLMRDDEDFRLIPKKIYKIPGYPEGQDLENCELLELADNYFIIACGGDWQDEKLVKFEIGDNDKLSAKVITDCEKEDKRVLKKKVAYILNSESVNKSMFTDWKVELHHLCDKKGLDYDSIIQEYDDKLTRYVAEEQLEQDAENVIAYRAYKDLSKSLTFSGYKLQGRTRLYGMDISIENKKGSYRKGVDADGHKWRTYMNYDYGYIRGTEGTDGDHVDCYIGPDKTADKVYVIHQNNPVTHKYDEDKCMLCFESADAAKKAYMKQYDRPGFFGSMETLTIDQFKSFVFSKQGSRIHKSFDVIVTDITENNKLKKVEQLEKSLTALKNNQPFVIRHIPRDESTYYGNVTLKIRNFKEDSIEKAVRTLSMSLGVPVKSPKGEVFLYKAQEDLTDKWCSFFSGVINDIYDFVTDYFDLPKMTVMSKANLSYKGKVLYYPDTGKPIKEADWKKFVSNLEKFLNRNIKDSDKKIILESSALAKILNRMLKYNTLDAVTKKRLEGLSYKDKSFDWISDSVKNMQAIFKNKDKDEVLTRNEQARIQILQQSAAQRITGVTNKIKDDVQQVLIDGVKSRKSRSQVSQDLFDKMVGDNRDFQRIADTEIQNACNNAFIREEVYNSAEGEKVYFQRLEIVDDNTCSFCRQMNGKIALWSEVPLPNEKVKDDIAEFALWEGKEWNGKGHCVAMGVFHPYCRGNWIRYKPELKGLESK